MGTLKRKAVISYQSVDYIEPKDVAAGMVLVEGIVLSVEHYKDYSIAHTLNTVIDFGGITSVAVLATVDATILKTLQEV